MCVWLKATPGERLARHLNMQSTASMDECLRHADNLLAVIAGREG
jgi:hypothetical protein